MTTTPQSFINDTVIRDKQPITYRLLSRSQNIKSSEAKKELLQFYNDNKDQIKPLWIVNGKPHDSEESFVIFIADTRQEAEVKCEVYGCEIYSLLPSDKELKVDEVISGVESVIKEGSFIGNIETWGGLANPEKGTIEVSEAKEKKALEKRKVERAQLANEESEKEHQAKKLKVEEQKVKVEEKKPEKPKKTSLFDNYVSRKGEKKEAKSNTKPIYQYTSRKPQPRERAVVFDVVESEEAESVEEAKERKLKEEQQKKDLEGMFDDTLEDIAVKEEDEEVEKGKEVEEVKEVEVEKEELEAETVKEESQEDKIETYVDDDGYTVTKKISKPKEDISKAHKVAKPPKKSEKKPDKKKQANLLSFFQKR